MEIKLTNAIFLYRKRLLMIIMRTFIFLCCTIVFSLSPNNIVSQNSKIKFEEDKTLTVDEVFKLIMNQTDYKFFYEKGLFMDFPKVQVKKGTIRTNKLLKRSLSQGSLDIEVTEDNAILIKEKPIPTVVNVQQYSISGIIVDINGYPLTGANIIEKGTTNGTQADFDGKFSFNITDGNAMLVISYLGFLTQEINVNNQTDISVTLQEDAAQLDEIVVVGYGTQKKESVTGSLATVQSDDLTRVPASNTTALLAGRLPGLIVDQGNGRPGDDTASITIRGFGANTSTGPQGERPLVIVDGFQRSFTQLDPNEIESITILKDASAAIYGVRGGAGVILVTTKRGKVGKPVITYNSTYSIQENTQFPELANFQEFREAAQTAVDHGRSSSLSQYNLADDSFPGLITPERRQALLNGSNPGTNWLDVVAKNSAPMQQHNLNVRGGNEAVKYFVSLGYLKQETLWKSGNFDYKRLNGTINLDAKISDKLSASVNLGWRRQDESDSNADGSGDFSDAFLSSPFFPSSLPDGRTPGAFPPNPFSPIASTTRNFGGFDDQLSDVLNASISLKYNIPGVEGLKLEGNAAIVQTHYNRKRLQRVYSLFYFDGANYTEQISQSRTNRLIDNNSRFERLTSQVALRYNRQFGDHSIGALVLYERQQEFSNNFGAQTGDLLSGAVPYLFSANPDNISVNGSASESGRDGIVTRINYAYKGKYLLEASYRRDASAFFPKNSRVGNFPGISLGWVASKENFLKDSKALSFLKLRASASRLGNDGANSFDYIEGFRILGTGSAYVFNGNFQTAIRTLGFPNTNITWQESDLYNVGLELGFLNNRLNVELDAFYRERGQLLAADTQSQGLPQTVGVIPPLQNIEARTNRGYEAKVSYKQNFGELKFNATGALSWAREKWKTSFSQQDFDDPDLARINKRDGEWVNRTLGYVFDGFFRDQAEIDAAIIDYDGGSAGNANIIPGDIKVKDLNGDNIIDNRDRQVIGRGSTPETIFSLNTQFEYKGWDLTMFWQGAANYEIGFNDDIERGIPLTANGSRTPFKYITDRVWSPENADNAVFPVDVLGVTNFGNIDKYRIDGTHLRLKNLVIGYNLPESALTHLGAKSLRLYLAGTNLITFDRLGFYPFDPETGNQNTYPIQKVYTFGVNVSF